MNRHRRQFLEDLGNGMLIAGLGVSLASDLGISPAFANDGAEALDFGDLRRLVGLMQETPAEKLQPILVRQLKDEAVDLRQLVAAAALANAETFGGQDYVGYHTEMALLPAYQMAQELPTDRRALPVLKVLYRNAERIQASGLSKSKRLKAVTPSELPADAGGEFLRQASRAADMEQAERIFAAQAKQSIEDAYNHLLWSVQDATDVHRFVLAHRTWGLIDVVGQQQAHTMLRQCIRYCVDVESKMAGANRPEPAVRQLTPKLLDQYHLLSQPLGTREPEDAWLDEMAHYILDHAPAQSMEAIAGALAEGFSPEAVGQAITLAANQLVLRHDTNENIGRRTHGDSPGVHSSDQANAWRSVARVANQRNQVVGLMVAAYCTRDFRSPRTVEVDPYPHHSHREAVEGTDARSLLSAAEQAIRGNDQGRAAAAVQIFGEQGHDPQAVFQLLLRYGISEDGRLHAEKYYRTVSEEFATTRPAFRWRHLVALARVTASEYGLNQADEPGHRAPGYEQACRLLGVEA